MDGRSWYEAESLMADLTSHRHEILGTSEEEIERRLRNHYPDHLLPPGPGRRWDHDAKELSTRQDVREERKR